MSIIGSLFGSPNIEKMELKHDVKGLAKALLYEKKRGDWRVRRDGAIALGRIGDVGAEGYLIAALQDKDDHVRSAVVDALGLLGDLQAVEPLLNTLQDINSGARKNAVRALGKIGDSRAVEPLIVLLKDKDIDVRRAVIGALGQIGNTRAVVSLISVLREGEGNVRKSALGALENVSDVSAIEPLLASLKICNSDDRKVIVGVLDNLRWQPNQAEEGAWYWAVKHGWNECVTMGSLAVEPLIAALQDADMDVCKGAANALSHIGDERAVEPLLSSLRKNDWSIREIVVKALDNIGWLPNESEDSAWYWMVKQDWDKCINLGSLAVEPLVTKLNGNKIDGCCAAADALGCIGDSQAVKPLLKSLAVDNWYFRDRIVGALTSIGWQPDNSQAAGWYWVVKKDWHKCVELGISAMPALSAAIDSNDKTIQKEAATASDQINKNNESEIKRLIDLFDTNEIYIAAQNDDEVYDGLARDKAQSLSYINQHFEDYKNPILKKRLLYTLERLIQAWADESAVLVAKDKEGFLEKMSPLVGICKSEDFWEAGVGQNTIHISRSFYARMLGNMMLRFLDDSDHSVRCSVASKFYSAVQEDEGVVRQISREYFNNISKDRKKIDLIISILSDTDFVSSDASAVDWILCAIGAPAVPSLIEALNDSNRNVRECSALILGGIGGAKAQQALKSKYYSTDDYGLKMNIEAALENRND